ncbi:hypothetical protein ACFQZZ_06650 [Nocardia sp. GCM10030253]|uniref:hypothetical protein n=1 Tax=Nocardia sp. GCM10030253 TaxID=3273404 RepID=UPI00362DD268
MKISIEQPTSPTSGMRRAPLSELIDPLDVAGRALDEALEQIVPKDGGAIPSPRRGSCRVADFPGRSR